MANRTFFNLLAIPVVALLLMSFQNCGSGFQISQESFGVSLSSLGSNDIPVGVVDAQGKTVQDRQDIIVDAEYTVSVNGVNVPANANVTWNATITAGGAVHVHPTASPLRAALHCEAPGTISLNVSILSEGRSYLSRVMTIPCIAAGTPTPDPTPDPMAAVVTFRIASGTGRGAWNTEANPVRVTVGQTLRIYNDDSIVHRLHTNGAPCNHQPNDTPPGGFFDCVVSRTIVPSNAGTYDHNIGTGARFYINAVPKP